MAVTDVQAFAHLSDSDLNNLATDLDAVRRDIEQTRGTRDARYIRRTIGAQRALEVAGRLLLTASSRRWAWWAGTAALASAKIIENMEIGHNVLHGQWDWMNDPEIHSSTWEWDMNAASKHWIAAHNVEHHKYTNIVGVDDDLGYYILRVTRDQPWQWFNVGNLMFNAILAIGFEWGIGTQSIDFEKIFTPGPARDQTVQQIREWSTKLCKQTVKDYLAFPALTSLSPGATFAATLKANVVANVIRNVWANAVIFCGHFPDGAEKFTRTDLVDESQGAWYLRQMLGSANFRAGPVLRFMSGNLCHQIEHHLFPDLPSNRLYEISGRIKKICQGYDLPYTTGPFLLQYAKTWRTIAKLSLPNHYLRHTSDNSAETRSENMFAQFESVAVIKASTSQSRFGLKSAIDAARQKRRSSRPARRHGDRQPHVNMSITL